MGMVEADDKRPVAANAVAAINCGSDLGCNDAKTTASDELSYPVSDFSLAMERARKALYALQPVLYRAQAVTTTTSTEYCPWYICRELLRDTIAHSPNQSRGWLSGYYKTPTATETVTVTPSNMQLGNGTSHIEIYPRTDMPTDNLPGTATVKVHKNGMTHVLGQTSLPESISEKSWTFTLSCPIPYATWFSIDFTNLRSTNSMDYFVSLAEVTASYQPPARDQGGHTAIPRPYVPKWSYSHSFLQVPSALC
ncbi:hypothetical protein [Lentzea sp. E54]|uniref:hypothetical protein n=1 Tax=Lentzea xerophila TaxID=3435883 RepID=UPI003DA236D7